jgi:hypothetical protein
MFLPKKSLSINKSVFTTDGAAIVFPKVLKTPITIIINY